MIPTLLSIIAAYLIGSISSSYIVGYLVCKTDMSREPDGRISASAVFSKFGLLPYAMVIILDIGLAAAAVLIAKLMTGSASVMILAGLAAVAGHNWSAMLKLKGGLGATAIMGALTMVITWQIFFALAAAGVVLLITHRSGLSTVIGLLASSGTLCIQYGVGLLAAYPLMLLSLMLIKRIQVAKLFKPIN